MEKFKNAVVPGRKKKKLRDAARAFDNDAHDAMDKVQKDLSPGTNNRIRADVVGANGKPQYDRKADDASRAKHRKAVADRQAGEQAKSDKEQARRETDRKSRDAAFDAEQRRKGIRRLKSAVGPHGDTVPEYE